MPYCDAKVFTTVRPILNLEGKLFVISIYSSWSLSFFNGRSTVQHRFMLSRNWKQYMRTYTLIVIRAEQYHGTVRLLEKQITEELRLEGTSGDDLVQLLFAELNQLDQVAQDHV